MSRLWWALAALVIFISIARPAAAQVPDLTLHGSLVFYGDDTEFSNPFRTGQTILGTYGTVFLDAALSDRLIVRAGGFGNWRFGSSHPVDQGHVILALVIGTDRSRFILGTLNTTRHLTGAGPDRTGPHGLLPMMQRETLAFDRPYEAGMQWTVDTARYGHDAWINWQRQNTKAHREIFDVGATARAYIRHARDIALRGDFHLVHQGGQQGGVEPVADSLAAAAGFEAGGRVDRVDRVSLEVMAVGSRNVPERGHPELADLGFGAMLRLAVEEGPWRVHFLIWRGHDFIKVDGDTLYQSIRRDGTHYRGYRDYFEAGLTRRWALGVNSFVETSARFHRIENHYEYSARILGVANFDMKFRK